MKKYIYKDKEYPSLYPIKQLLPNVGIPSFVTDEQLKALGITVKVIEPTIEEVRDNKINQLKYERDYRETLPVIYKNKTFDYDDKARERMRIAQQALEDNNISSQVWTCADNTITELTITDFKNINTIVAQRSGSLHTQYNRLKSYINMLDSVDKIKLVTFDTNVE